MPEQNSAPPNNKPPEQECTHPESKRTYGQPRGADGPPAMLFVRDWRCECGETGSKVVHSNV